FDLNQRFTVSGRAVWFDADLDARYLPRRDLTALARQYHRYGLAKGTAWVTGRRPVPRQVALLVAPVVAGAALAVLGARPGVSSAVVVAGVGAVLVDQAGSSGRAGPSVRAVSIAAVATTTAAWWTGAVRGLVTGRRRRATGDPGAGRR